MATNMIEYAEIWARTLDQQAEQQATSGWMESNSTQIQYSGGNKVRIPTLTTTGLGDYLRGTGASNRGKYANGGINLSYQEHTMTMDRSSSFAFDRNDVDESNFIIQAPAVMAEFQRSHVISELDAYRYSTIASKKMATGANNYETQTLTTNNVIDEFLRQIRDMQNVTGLNTANLVATMPYSIYSILERSAELTKQISPQTFSNGSLQFEVKTINGVPLIPVVESRMKTEYLFKNGDTEHGFVPTGTAKTINWIICPRSLPIAVSKTDNLKVFTPDTNQNGDDWLIQYRKYHDLWIKDNQMNQIILSVQG